MINPVEALTHLFQSALGSALGADFATSDPVIRPVNPKQTDADYQANAAMALAKQAKKSPRDVAAAIVEHLPVGGDLIERAEIAGPGFINVWLTTSWVEGAVARLADDAHLGIPQQPAETIVIDYSSPNAAKEMLVGHLRTTVVGDSLARTLEALGHNVVRQNHLGDWGTPFGMLIEHLLDVGRDSEEAQQVVTSPNTFYQAARAKFDASEDFAKRARARVTALQSGDEESLELWDEILTRTKAYLRRAYTDLDVTLTDDDIMGESAYYDELAQVCEELEAKGIAEVDDGALCVFSPKFLGREDEPVPLIIRKSDGGYGYGTTDLATIRYRAQKLGASRALYVVGAPQHLHFSMVWDAAERAGWMGDCTPTHVQIGNVVGPDGKILRSRSGESMKLQTLVDEAMERAAQVVAENSGDLTAEQQREISHQVGVAAVKYSDLSISHDASYMFDADRIVAFNGNTGPYLQYAATRIGSILTKATDAGTSPAPAVSLAQPAERKLGMTLLRFGGVVAEVGDKFEPHRLAMYLFDVAQSFTTFYEQCPVLKAEDEATVRSRLALAAVTRAVLVRGLSLLGIQTPERM